MRFVILAAPRTGSTHLVTTLSRQSDVLCHAEVFGRRIFLHKASDPRNAALMEELSALRGADDRAFVERVFAVSEGREHVGFKIFQGQHDAALERLVDDAAIRKVILYRRNMLAAYSSALAAKEAGIWRKDRQAGARPKARVKFHAERFMAFHDRRIGFYAAQAKRLAETAQPFCWIDYEDINEPLKIMNLLGFIGAAPQLVRHGKKAQRREPNDICGRFDDPAAVQAFLRERKLLHWMYEGELSLAAMGKAQQ